MTESLETGSLRPRNINRTFGICYKLSAESCEKDQKRFIKHMRKTCESYILDNRNTMFVQNLCDDRFISYIYLYSEIGSVLSSTLNKEIVDFFFSFLDIVGKGQVLTGILYIYKPTVDSGIVFLKSGIFLFDFFAVHNDSMLPEKISCILSVLTGLSSFSQDICSRFVPHLGKILRLVDHSEVSFTAIKCLGFLCKK